MTAEIQLRESAHGLKRECLSYGEVIAQSIAVIAPTTTPAANLALISLFCHSPKTFAISERRELLYTKRSPDFFLTTNTATKFF
jgi:hypothetical protein